MAAALVVMFQDYRLGIDLARLDDLRFWERVGRDGTDWYGLDGGELHAPIKQADSADRQRVVPTGFPEPALLGGLGGTTQPRTESPGKLRRVWPPNFSNPHA